MTDDIDLKLIDPGIRDLVVYLNSLKFKVVARSGAILAISCSYDKLIHESMRLAFALAQAAFAVEPGIIQAIYDPADDSAVILYLSPP